MLLPEKHRLVAGIFASKEAADAAMKKIKDLRPRLQKVNASNILVLAKDNKGKVEINIIDIDSTSGTNSISLVERVAADVNTISVSRLVFQLNQMCRRPIWVML
jgi:phosphopantetheinyl transferase (holo-ACP synthase)